MAAASLNIPYIPITTGLGYVFLVNNFISRIAKILYKIAFRRAKQVWFLNQDDVNAFKKEKLIDENKISILKGEGIDVNQFEVHHTNKEISFLLVARMLWDKGVGEYVEAAKILKAKYPNTKFKLLGFLGVDNPSAISKEQMEEWIKEGNIEYLGTTNNVKPFLYDASCIVLPSYREGISFSLLEGAASGKPLVTTNAIGCKDIVDNEVTGYLCQLKDPIDLAKQMEKIILMPEGERIKMGLKGREKIEKEFGLNLVINKYVEILNRI
jgi:glycosyltransferase involved in cell wall biosynthesis